MMRFLWTLALCLFLVGGVGGCGGDQPAAGTSDPPPEAEPAEATAPPAPAPPP